MFGYQLAEMKEQMRSVFDTQLRMWAGAAFMALAMVSIQYEEIIAPGVDRISDAWGTAATDVGRRISSLTL